MNKALIGFALLLSGCTAIPQDSPESRRALATQIVDAQMPERQWKEMRGQVERTATQNPTLESGSAQVSPEVQRRMEAMTKGMWTIMDKHLTVDKFRSVMIDAYSATFTTEELSGVQQFYASPAGKAFLAKQPDLTKRMFEATQAMMKDIMPELKTAASEAVLEQGEVSEPRPSPVLDRSNPEDIRKKAAEIYPDVKSRFDRARELASEGKPSEALAEYLWCFDVGMRLSAQYNGLRVGSLLSSISRLGRIYAPASQALRERRDAARAALDANPNDNSAQLDFVCLNRTLGENNKSVEFYDRLPADSPARPLFGPYVFDQLLAEKRYQDAAAAQPFSRFKQAFDSMADFAQPQPDHGKRTMANYVRLTAANELEALAGAGDIDQARKLLDLILKADNSEETVATLRRHLERAGHGELLEQEDQVKSWESPRG